MKIITYGHTTLHRKAEPVENIDEAFVKTVEEMFQLMYHSNGIGLAAPQVNISRKFFIADTREEGEKIICINPKIVARLNKEEEMEEGCLSLPGIYGPVSRPVGVTVEYTDINGKPQILKARGLLARVILHEYDHLEGILFIDHLKKDYLQQIAEEIESIKKKK